jgi:hypothetical protein
MEETASKSAAAPRLGVLAPSEREKAITNLRSRAKRAKRKLIWIVALLVFGIVGVAAVDYAEVRAYSAQVELSKFAELRRSISLPTYGFGRLPPTDLQGKLSALLDEQIGHFNVRGDKAQIALPPRYDELDRDIDKTIEQYAKAVDAATNKATLSTNWESLLKALVIDIGAISFGVLFIQNALSFMRYYAQLAELYEAQADALVAAEGDQDRAAKFLEQFSPSVQFGITPATVYEKALEVIKETAAAAKAVSK